MLLPKTVKLDGALRMVGKAWGRGLKETYFILITGVPVKGHQDVLLAEKQA